MSLILDALRKSEAERQRGQAPSLHSLNGRSRTSPRIWPVAGAVAVLALVGGTSWIVLKNNDSAVSAQNDAQADATAPISSDPQRAVAGEPVLSQASAMNQGSLSTQPVLERESAPMMASDVALGNAQLANQSNSGSGGGEWPDPALNAPATGAVQPYADQTVNLPPTIPSAAAPPVQGNPAVVTAPAPPVAPSAPIQVEGLADPAARPFIPSQPAPDAVAVDPDAPVLPTIYELDFSVRRDLPKLNMSMLVYAKDPQRRFALVNGKRYVPGGEAIDGKVLVVDVLPDGLVCEINGQRFLLPRQ